jgi:hypothetical protein
MSLFNPMHEIMGQKNEAQECVNSVAFAGAQVLDVIDMPGLGEKCLDSLALIVEGEAALHAEAVSGQVGVTRKYSRLPSGR